MAHRVKGLAYLKQLEPGITKSTDRVVLICQRPAHATEIDAYYRCNAEQRHHPCQQSSGSRSRRM